MRCFVTGGTGFVGSHLVEACLARGWSVAALVRRPDRLGWLANLPIDLIVGDLDDDVALERGVRDADLVFHAAGLVKSQDIASYFRVNQTGAEAVARACLRQPRPDRRFVLISSQAAAGPSRAGEIVTEDRPGQPVSPYGLSKLAGEAAVLGYIRDLDARVVRPPTVYGPRDREGFAVFRLLQLGIRPRLPVKAISIVHVTDLVDGIIRAGLARAARGRTYFVANDQPVATTELWRLIGESLGRRSVELPVPARLIEIGGAVTEAVGRVTRHPVQFDRYKARELTVAGWVCSNARARAELAWQPRVELPAGVAATVQWYRTAGWL